MSPQGHRSRARLLAPIALVAFAIAFLAVVAASGTGDGDGGSSDSSDSTAQATSTTKTKTTPKPAAATYTVKTGDTLGAIAQKTGVDVETLQELNPALDPQSLVSGQKIKLRE